MLLRKFLKIFIGPTAMVILVLFEQFSAKFCLNILLLILRALPNVKAMTPFFRTFSIMHA